MSVRDSDSQNSKNDENANSSVEDMSDLMLHECHSCGHTIKARIEDMGEIVDCPSCGTQVTIPVRISLGFSGKKRSKASGTKTKPTVVIEEESVVSTTKPSVENLNQAENAIPSTAQGQDFSGNEESSTGILSEDGSSEVIQRLHEKSIDYSQEESDHSHIKLSERPARQTKAATDSDTSTHSGGVYAFLRKNKTILTYFVGSFLIGAIFVKLPLYGEIKHSIFSGGNLSYDETIESVFGELQTVTRRWRAAVRSYEEIRQLEITREQWISDGRTGIISTIEASILQQENDVARDRELVLEGLGRIAELSRASPDAVREAFERAIEAADRNSSPETLSLLFELETLFPPEFDSTQDRDVFLEHWNQLASLI